MNQEMALSTRPYKGTRDFYPEDQRIQNWMFSQMRLCAESFGYQEYDGPQLEPFELYAAKTGEEIVNQQLYWMTDRGDRKLAIRPEMTPTLARMVAGKINELPKPIRWFSIPNLWRYERPQRGRLREHWQLNIDVLGGDSIMADAEIISFALALMKSFGGEEFVEIKINNRRLMDHFFVEKLGLKPDQALAATKAVDARDKIGEEAFKKSLSEAGISEKLAKEMEAFFTLSFEEISKKFPCQGVDELKKLFEILNTPQAVFAPTVLRGLDYYTGTVFEMYDVSPENNRAMFGGGRYDNLVELFGKPKLSGVGFGMGDVTLRNFLETHHLMPKLVEGPDVFVTLPRAEDRKTSDRIANDLREAGFKVMTPLEVGKFSQQLKQASKHGARVAIILGEAELSEGKVVLKDLSSGEQKPYFVKDLKGEVGKCLSS